MWVGIWTLYNLMLKLEHYKLQCQSQPLYLGHCIVTAMHRGKIWHILYDKQEGKDRKLFQI